MKKKFKPRLVRPVEASNFDWFTTGLPTASLNELAAKCHNAELEMGWCHDLNTGRKKKRNFGELVMLVVTELAEMVEGERKNLMDDHLPHRRMSEVECADALIRLFGVAGWRGWDLDGALYEKLAYNRTRADHQPRNRKKKGGKKF